MIKYKNKVVSAAYALIISMGLLSCNMTNDKQEMGLSPKEKQEAFQEAKGEYKGFVYFDDRKTSDNVLTLDSAEVTINILTDSTMVIHDMPSKVLVAKVAPSNLKTAVTKYSKPVLLRKRIQKCPDPVHDCPALFQGIPLFIRKDPAVFRQCLVIPFGNNTGIFSQSIFP